MKKLLAFLIMLMVGAALFAVPFANEHGAISAKNTVEAVPQLADALAVVADVSPAITPAENYFIVNDFEVSTKNNETWKPVSLYRQEVSPYFGYSKTANLKMNSWSSAIDRFL